MKKKLTIIGVKFEYDENNIRIINPRYVQSSTEMYVILDVFRERIKYAGRRSINSWVKEWKAHNRLYKLGLFKKHCVDCDLCEQEPWYRLLAYQILGM